MPTSDTIQSYYDSLRQKKGWETFLSEDMVFTNNGKTIRGKQNYLESTKRFFATIQSLEIQELLIQGEKACAVVRYTVKSPKGNTFTSDVAEFFALQEGKFEKLAIYFDTAPYNA